MVHGNFRQQTLKARAPVRKAPASAQVLIDGQNPVARPAQRHSVIGQRILSRQGLPMLDHLLRRRLPHIDNRQPVQMPLLHLGGSQSAWLCDRGFLFGGTAGRLQRGVRLMTLHASPPSLREVREACAAGCCRTRGALAAVLRWESFPRERSAADCFRSDSGAGGSCLVFVA